jgi:hypothetical protein
MLMTIPFSATVSTSGFWLGLVAMMVSVAVEGWSLLVLACSGNGQLGWPANVWRRSARNARAASRRILWLRDRLSLAR